MTLAAISVGRYMVGRFAHGGGAIVTGCAVAHDTCVIILGADKGRGVMAYGTVQCCGNMIHRFAGGRCTIMARGAVIHDTRVIKYCR